MSDNVGTTVEVAFEFQYSIDGKWHTINITAQTAANILNDGLVDGKQIATVNLWEISGEEGGKAKLIYDFVAKNTGVGNPWRVA